MFLVVFRNKKVSGDWHHFGAKLFRMGWDIKGLYEQSRVLVIDITVLFYR